jgi:two-component system chemotaxis response regulator CheB
MNKEKGEKKKKECDYMDKKKKVLVIDDSAFMRRVISDIINNDPRCTTIGTAVNGEDGLKKVKELEPDVISLDIQMPIMDGLTMLKKLNRIKPTPVVMMSTLTKEGANETIEALELGAFDFVAKPSNIFKVNSDEIKDELIEKLILAAKSGSKSVKKFKPSITKTLRTSSNEIKRVKKSNSVTTASGRNTKKVNKLVALGTSTGGPRALQYVLPYLPENINAPIVIVQHMPPGFTKSLSVRLNQLSAITVKEAEHNEVLQNGVAYIAPGAKHLLIKQVGSEFRIELSNDPPKGGHKPAVDVMMNSIINLSGINKLIGVIMTGMGSDGMEGLDNINNKRDIHIIAQNEESCVVYGMPK